MRTLNWQKIISKPETRKKATIFVLCLLFSVAAWVSTKLSREGAAEFAMEIQLSNVPEDILVYSLGDTTINTSIQASGLKLLAIRWSGKYNSLALDFQSLQPLPRQANTYYITRHQLATWLARKENKSPLAFGVRLDTLFVQTRPAITQKIPIKPQFDLQFAKGFGLYGEPRIVPDSVWIKTPKESGDTTGWIVTEKLSRTGIDESITLRLSLKPTPYQIIMNPEDCQVEVHLPVEKFTESTLVLPLHTDCLHDTTQGKPWQVLLFPDNITVYFWVAMKDLNGIEASMFKARAQCPDTTYRENLRIKTYLSEKPQQVEITRLRPQEVEYIIVK